jgi:hypothetical protein
VEKPNTGHHHLLIDAPLTAEQVKFLPMTITSISAMADGNHGGFAESQHTLQLVLGNWTHVPHVPPVMSEPITITVR